MAVPDHRATQSANPHLYRTRSIGGSEGWDSLDAYGSRLLDAGRREEYMKLHEQVAAAFIGFVDELILGYYAGDDGCGLQRFLVMALPGSRGATRAGLLIRTDSGGMSFIASPCPLPWLDETIPALAG
jgi:hypothetical protein